MIRVIRFLNLLFFLSLPIVFGGCILVVDDDLTDVCGEEPLVGEPISDITLAPGDAFERDLERGRYPVFIRGDDYSMSYEVDVEDGSVARGRVSSGVLRIEARSTGETRVYIRAFQRGCENDYATTSFDVFVSRP